MNMIRTVTRLGVLAAACAVTTGCGDSSSELVATAEEHQITVGELARIMALDDRITADHRVALELADLWVDYTLLADAVAEDPSLSGVDLSAVVEQRVDQEQVVEFRSVIQLDTAMTEVELRQTYNAQAVDLEVRVRHLLVTWPEEATAAQADSVRQLVTTLRDRIVGGGEDFAQIAREFSDGEEAADGGDTGFFAPGEKIESVEQVAFSLEPGQISDPFESGLGVHVLRVEERRTPPIEDFRAWLQEQRTTEALATYIVALEVASGAAPADDAVRIVRRMARFPRRPIDEVPEDRAVIEYEGGAVTVDEVRRFMLSRPTPFRLTVASASDQEISDLVLATMLRSEVLVVEAEAQGVTVSEARRAEIEGEVREGLRALAVSVGLDETQPGGVQSAVAQALERTARGEQEVVPLGGYAYALSRGKSVEVDQAGLDAVVQQLDRIRG